MIINSGDHSPRYFYTIYPIKSKPNAFYSSYRMSQLSQLMISGCYDEHLADLSLLQSFSEDEWMSVHELPIWGTLFFYIVSEDHFSWAGFHGAVGPGWSQVHYQLCRKTMSKEINVDLWEIGEVSLGMVTVFCHPSGALSCTFDLIPVDSPELGLVVVKIFTNSPYIPQGVFWLPLPWCNHPFSGHFNHSISPDPVAPMQVTPILFHSSHPAIREGGR